MHTKDAVNIQNDRALKVFQIPEPRVFTREPFYYMAPFYLCIVLLKIRVPSEYTWCLLVNSYSSNFDLGLVASNLCCTGII